MELTNKDKIENEILAILVIAQNNRLYNYYINGLQDRRIMLQRKILQFCIDLCPDHASEIRRCIFEMHPFIIYPKDNTFNELQEKSPPKINRRTVLFPMGKQVKANKIDLTKENEDGIKKLAKNFSIWDTYNIHLDIEKQKSGKNLFNIFQ